MVTVTKILAASVFAVASLLGGSGDPMKVKPVQTMAGGDSRLDFPLIRMIQNQKAWQELWTLHKGMQPASAAKDNTTYTAPTPPTVDFDKNQVMVMFGGHMSTVQAYEYVKTYDRDGTAVIQIGQNYVPESAAKEMKHPFILLVLPKEPVPIDIELDTIAKDGSHFWKKLASYRAPKPAG